MLVFNENLIILFSFFKFRYIYGGIVNLDNKEAADILNLLIACEKLKLKELYDYFQDYLIEHHQAWLSQNFAFIRQVSFKCSEFTKLQNYWTTTVCEQPEILFNAADFTSIDKEALLSICKNEDLCMEENELWDHLIRWGKLKVQNYQKKLLIGHQKI